LGCGIQAVIAKSFAFIYGRNAPNLGLLGIVILDEGFYEKAKDGAEVEVDLGQGVVRLFSDGGEVEGEWPFEMSDMEKELIEIGGLTSAFRRFGKGLFDVLTTPKGKRGSGKAVKDDKSCGTVGDLQW
jgi:3-isopropylmalate dehydratase small subunit